MTTITQFDPSSVEYRAVTYAAKGEVNQLEKLELSVLNHLTPVQESSPKKFTPLHYAVLYKKWAAVAFLIHAGCSALIKSVEANSRTALDLLSKDEMSLNHLFGAFVQSQLPWNLDAMVPVITDDALLIQRREVLKDHDLLMKIGSHGEKTEALVMVASMMVGSFRWQGHDTDLANWLRGVTPFDIDGSINCNQLLACAAYFCGVSKETLNTPHIEVDLVQMMKDREMMESGKIPMASMKKESQFVSNFFGLPLNHKERVLLSIKKAPQEKIRVFYAELNEHIAHYGLLVQLNGKSYAIHIDPEVCGKDQVAIDPAALAFKDFRTLRAKIYLSMLPWMS